jgi:DNA-binding CsgD family transcriptional regulator
MKNGAGGAYDHGISVKRRFSLYILAFFGCLMLVFVTLLSISRAAQPALYTENILRKEVNTASNNLKKQFGDVSLQAVFLSDSLSKSIQKTLDDASVKVSALDGKRDLLEEILSQEINRLLLSIGKTLCSGVFLVLNATVNLTLENARYSKAGLYIRNVERNYSEKHFNQLFLRGPTQIAIRDGLTLQSNWDLEFDVRGKAFWERPLEALRGNPELPISRLFYWYLTDGFEGTSDKAVVCCVPILGRSGDILGVCGLEISARSFARQNILDMSDNTDMVGFFHEEGERVDLGKSMFIGNLEIYDSLFRQGDWRVSGNAGKLELFYIGGEGFVGLSRSVPVYPSDSPFSPRNFALSVVIPQSSYESDISASYLQFILIIVVMICFGVTLSILLSNKYEKPYTQLLEAIHSGNIKAKANILEIDDLMEFLLREAEEEKKKNTPAKSLEAPDVPEVPEISENFLDIFIENTKALSRAETKVFNLYLEGYSAAEIISMLDISINTLKTHNKRIYSKLSVSSRKELLVWGQLWKTIGNSPIKDKELKKKIDQIGKVLDNTD